jgi:hypothetical protein
LKGKEMNVTNLIEIKTKSLKTLYFNVCIAESAAPSRVGRRTAVTQS